jgi:hypothetical protein
MATQRIREFSEGVQYVLGDVALYNDAASSTTIVKRCKKNTPIGEFQPNDWEDIFSFPTSKKSLQGVINTAERITTQTLLYGERMSRVTAIPHLIPQTKMVKVMQALEKRAPRSTENIGGKEYKLKGSVYCSLDRKSTDGKDITDVGYLPVMNLRYSDGKISVKNVIEFTKDSQISVISADLPFIQTTIWTTDSNNNDNPSGSDFDSAPDFNFENESRYDLNRKGYYKEYRNGIGYHISLDEAKPFAHMLFNDNTTNKTNVALTISTETDSNLFGTPRLPRFVKKLGITPENGFISAPSIASSSLSQGRIWYRAKSIKGTETPVKLFSAIELDGVLHPSNQFSGVLDDTARTLSSVSSYYSVGSDNVYYFYMHLISLRQNWVKLSFHLE